MKIESGIGGKMDTFWGQSYTSFDEAVKAAVASARESLPDGTTLEWLEVTEFRGGFKDDQLQYQTAVRIGYH